MREPQQVELDLDRLAIVPLYHVLYRTHTLTHKPPSSHEYHKQCITESGLVTFCSDQMMVLTILTFRLNSLTSSPGSPKDLGRIEGWDKCPSSYKYPDDSQIIAIIEGALESLKKELKKPLMRRGAGGEPFTIWREDMNDTPRNPLVLTRVAKNKVGMPTCSD